MHCLPLSLIVYQRIPQNSYIKVRSYKGLYPVVQEVVQSAVHFTPCVGSLKYQLHLSRKHSSLSQLLRKEYSFINVKSTLSIARYLFMQLDELALRGVNEIVQASKRRIRTEVISNKRIGRSNPYGTAPHNNNVNQHCLGSPVHLKPYN